MRIWGKLWENNHLLRDTVIENYENMTRTQKVFQAIEKICYEFDLSQPIWLDNNIRDFQRSARTRFTEDSFIGESGFDYLEIQVIEED